MIKYINSAKNINKEQLIGFFQDWPSHPNTEKHLELLQKSDKVILAMDENRVVGFITAISDGILSAYVPFLEVLEEYQGKKIGSKLVELMLKELDGLYMIDLMCDVDLKKYYKKFGFKESFGMSLRNYKNQKGK